MIKITADSFMGIIYTAILAIIIAVFVGVTINTFYPAPDYPENDVYQKAELENREPTKAEIAKDEAQMKEYDQKRKDWSTTVSIVVIIAAAALVALGLFMAEKMPILPNGVLLGGLFTIFYGIILGLSTDDRYITFGVTTTALIIIVGAGYLKFVKTKTE